MKYKVGDKVLVKSLDWYNQNKYISLIETTNSDYNFIEVMQDFCGKVMTISSVNSNYYDMVEDAGEYFWTDEMIERLVERNGKIYPYKIGDRVVLKGRNRCATITDLKYDSFGNLSYYINIDNEYKRFGIKVDEINGGLSFGVCISYDKYMKECYLFINLIKWEVSIGWLTFERKEEQL